MESLLIRNLHNTIMQSVLGGSLHKNNTSYLLLGLYHALVNKISIVLMQITPKMNGIMGFVQVVNKGGSNHFSYVNLQYLRDGAFCQRQ